MIADMIRDKKLNLIVTELFITGRKFYIPLVGLILLYRKRLVKCYSLFYYENLNKKRSSTDCV